MITRDSTSDGVSETNDRVNVMNDGVSAMNDGVNVVNDRSERSERLRTSVSE